MSILHILQKRKACFAGSKNSLCPRSHPQMKFSEKKEECERASEQTNEGKTKKCQNCVGAAELIVVKAG